MSNSNNRNNNNQSFSGGAILGDKVNNQQSEYPFDDKNEEKSLISASSERTLAHLTIKQIATATQDDDNTLIVDGQNVNQVMIYGTLKAIDRQEIHTTLTVHDYTGRIKVKFWNSRDNDNGIDDKLNKLKFCLNTISIHIWCFFECCSVL